MNGISAALWMAAAACVFALGMYAFNTLDQNIIGIALTVLVFPVCLLLSVSHIPMVQKRVDKWFGGDE